MADPAHVIVVLNPVTSKLELIASPFLAHVDREIQEIRWFIGVAGFFWPEEGGVIFVVEDPPEGYMPWPGSFPVRDKHQYVASVNLQVPKGEPSQKYKYDIFLLDSEGNTHVLSTTEHFGAFVDEFGPDHVYEVDPDIQNDPLP